MSSCEEKTQKELLQTELLNELTKPGVLDALNELLGLAPKNEKHVPARERNRQRKTDKPDFVLRVRNYCCLCDSTDLEYFLMVYNPEFQTHVSKKLNAKTLTFVGFDPSLHVNPHALRATDTEVNVLTDGSTKTLQLKRHKTLVQSCKFCPTVLSQLDKNELIGKLLRRASKLEETRDSIRNLVKLTTELDLEV